MQAYSRKQRAVISLAHLINPLVKKLVPRGNGNQYLKSLLSTFHNKYTSISPLSTTTTSLTPPICISSASSIAFPQQLAERQQAHRKIYHQQSTSA